MQETTAFLSKKFSGLIAEITTVYKEDLDLPNHLVGLKQTYLKLSFLTTSDMTKVRKEILSAVRRNKDRLQSTTAYTELLAEAMTMENITDSHSTPTSRTNPMDNLLDIREYDLPLHVRVSIDCSIFVGTWYTV